MRYCRYNYTYIPLPWLRRRLLWRYFLKGLYDVFSARILCIQYFGDYRRGRNGGAAGRKLPKHGPPRETSHGLPSRKTCSWKVGVPSYHATQLEARLLLTARQPACLP